MLEEMRRMLKGQNEKIESMYRENQELREKVSFLTTVIFFVLHFHFLKAKCMLKPRWWV